MSFITQSKTNWKFISIVFVLAIIVAGGVWWWQQFKGIEEIISPQVIEKKDISQFLNKNAVLIEPNMPKEANYNAISAREAASVVIQGLTEKSVKDIKIHQVIWFVAPFGGFYVAGNCSFDKEDNHYTLFVARIRDGSEGDIGEPTILFKGENKTIWPNNLEYEEFLGGYEAMAKFYDISPLLTLEEIKDETADWQTYRNEEYGFEAKYPETWEVDLRGAPSFVRFDVKGNNYLTEEEFKAKGGIYYSHRFMEDITIEIFPSVTGLPGNEKSLSLQEWINDRKESHLVGDQKEVQIGGQEGVEIEEWGISTWRSIFLIRNNIIYNFQILEHHSEMSVFNQILSTFRFLD